jgi:exonuclease SbcC
MKPLILVLQAFGPYAGRQTIDFRPILDAGLFGIYGATGSGKSTIFSALTFALFGEAARAEQHATTLRSDHADPIHLTQVELIFESAGRTYRIVRQPEQTRPLKRGSGETKELHKAWLFDVTGLDPEALNDTNPGKVLAETKVKIVDDAVRKLLGYGPAQFRQIVLLPQGRFEAFLSADTKERVEILRDLFDVSLYRRLTERIKSQADAASKKVEAARLVCAGRLSAENFASMEELAEGIADADHRHRDRREAAANAKAAFDAAATTYQAAAQTDQHFKEHLAAENDLARVDGERSDLEILQARLMLARIVQSLADAARSRDNAVKAAGDAAQRHAASAARVKACQDRAQSARAAHESLVEKSREIEKHKSTLHTFRGYEAKIAASAALHDAAAEALTTVRTRSTAAAKAKAGLDALDARKNAATKSLQTEQTNKLERAHLTATLTELSQRHAAATAHGDAAKKLAAARINLERTETIFATAAAAFRSTELDYASAETALLKDHAAHLAAHLTSGEPCPVCGSSEHPAPARDAQTANRLDETYARAKARFDEAAKRSAEANTEVQLARQSAADREATLNALVAPTHPIAELAADLQSTTAALNRLGIPVDMQALQASLAQLDTEIKDAAAALERALTSQSAATADAAAAQRSVDDAIAAIPSDLRNLKALAAAIAALLAMIATFDSDQKAATAADRDAAAAFAAAKQEAETLSAEVARLAAERTQTETDFAARLAEHGLTADDYERRKADIPAIAEFESRIRAYADRHAVAQQRLERAQAAITNIHRPDLSALAATRDAAAKSLEDAQSAAAEAGARLDQLTKLQSDLTAEGERLDKLEKETAPLRELSEAFAGKTYQKIDLETFAISTLFDHVLDAANLRLSPMTRGRYSLVREAEGRGNARRGLGIAVEDTYTGRQRPTSTLSGGETFIAALALALGLSDVVESANGAVRLDTIFIDEGFGSLDSENDAGTLENVLQTLQDLVGATRAVGLISHVPLVQQAIPNGFFVTKTPAGSHIEVRT